MSTPSDLTDLERTAFRYLAGGASRAEVAELTESSENAVQMIMQRVRTKLGAKNNTHAACILVSRGEISVGDIGRAMPECPSQAGPVARSIWNQLDFETDWARFRRLRDLYDDALQLGV
jgi:DNA-binding CsgD family transcriptional regulator